MSSSREALGAPPDVISSRPGWILACVSLCTVLVIGFVASINLAVPKLAASSMHPTASQLLWIVDAYVVLFACLVIPAGALGDRVGSNRVLVSGLLVFALGAIVSALANDVSVMLTGRAITGIGAACVLPNALAVLIHATEPPRRPQAIAVWAGMSGLGGVIGNVGGGAILTVGSWRWLFAAVAPIAMICAIWVATSVPRSSRSNRSLDLPAAVTLTLATLSLLLGITQGPDHGWTSTLVVGAFAAAVVFFAVWLIIELRVAQPLLDPRLFRIPTLRSASLGMLVVFFGLFGFFYLNASLMQYGRGFSVLKAGLAVLPLTVPLIIGSRYVPKLTRKIDERVVIALAFAVIGVGIFGIATALEQSYSVYACWLAVAGVGITLALPTLTAAISGSIPPEQAGVAGGLQSTTREFGSALGVAIIGTLLNSRFVHQLNQNAPDLQFHGDTPRTVAEALSVAPDRYRVVVAAFTSSAESALKIVAVLVLAVGVLIVAEMSLAARRASYRSEVVQQPS